ncbi:MAG: shikimate kinase [Eubacterium sp.]|nr:shikimate kinase [Eubacterium sp.]
MSSNIVLIGMPGSGKSTCGVLAAKALLKNFFDTDLLLQNLEGKRLQSIINENGIEYFNEAEERAILSLDIRGTVIATGGSVVYSEKAMAHLRSLGKIIYLRLGYEEMEKRIKNITTRGIVLKGGETLLDMYNERAPLYERYADEILNCDGMTVEETVESIVLLSE